MSSQPGAPKPALERLAGLVERVTFHNADTGFCVLRLKVKGEASDFLFCFSGYAGSHRPEDCKTGEDAAASKFQLEPVRDIQVLCPMNRSITGMRNLNVLLQGALNPPNESSVEKFGARFSIGNKVMQTENNYD